MTPESVHARSGSRGGRRVAQAFDLAGTTNAGGAPSFADFAKGGGAGPPFHSSKLPRVPRSCRAFCDRAGILTSYPHHDSHLFSLPRRPLRLNLHHSFNPRKIVTKTAPRPILRTLRQTALYRITVHVTQLLDPLGLAPDIEVVISRLPQQTALGRAQAPRYILLEHLQRDGKLGALRLAHQQMNVFGHNHVSRDVKSIPLPRLLESFFEEVAGVRRTKKRSASIAAKRHKVQTACFLKALETPRHVCIVTPDLGCEDQSPQNSSSFFRNRESQGPRPVAESATRAGHPRCWNE